MTPGVDAYYLEMFSLDSMQTKFLSSTERGNVQQQQVKYECIISKPSCGNIDGLHINALDHMRSLFGSLLLTTVQQL